MIRHVFGVPSVGLVDALFAFESAGLPLAHLTRKSSTGFNVHLPSFRAVYAPDVFLFVDDFQHLRRKLPALLGARKTFILLLAVPTSTLKEFSVPILSVPLTRDALVGLLTQAGEVKALLQTQSLSDLAEQPMRKASFVQRLYPAFYRILDKAARTEAHQKVYAYLSGASRVKPTTGIALIDTTIASPVADRVRQACAHASRTSVDDALRVFPDVDEHTLNYVVSQVNKHAKKPRKP